MIQKPTQLAAKVCKVTHTCLSHITDPEKHRHRMHAFRKPGIIYREKKQLSLFYETKSVSRCEWEGSIILFSPITITSQPLTAPLICQRRQNTALTAGERHMRLYAVEPAREHLVQYRSLHESGFIDSARMGA